MGLSRQPGLVKATHTDPVPLPLQEKIVPGQNTQVSVRNGPYGEQLVIHALSGSDEVSRGTIVETTASTTLSSDVVMAIVNAQVKLCEITLPHPGEVLGWLTIVCADNRAGVSLRPTPGTTLFDASNIDFNSPGDALILASNRKDTWYCIARYTAHFEY